MPTARCCLGVAAVDGKIFAIGGQNASSWSLSENEMYDPATNQWLKRSPIPTERADFGIAVYQNKIYCIGGSQIGAVSTNEVYDPKTDSWATLKPMPYPRSSLRANVVGDKIYLIGGSDALGGADLANYNQVYDPATDTWILKSSIPTSIAYYASAVINGEIYVIGGIDLHLNQVYNPATDTWRTAAPIPNAAFRAVAGATTGTFAQSKIYVFGGFLDHIQPQSYNQIYDPATNRWSNGASMPTATVASGVTVVDDKLYVLGSAGFYLDPPLATNQRYTPTNYGSLQEPLTETQTPSTDAGPSIDQTPTPTPQQSATWKSSTSEPTPTSIDAQSPTVPIDASASTQHSDSQADLAWLTGLIGIAVSIVVLVAVGLKKEISLDLC